MSVNLNGSLRQVGNLQNILNENSSKKADLKTMDFAMLKADLEIYSGKDFGKIFEGKKESSVNNDKDLFGGLKDVYLDAIEQKVLQRKGINLEA